jgi:hypothetical protein
MSRGLGKFQRTILEAMQADQTPGGVYQWGAIQRAVGELLGYQWHYSGYGGAFDAAFSRAIRTLDRRGLVRHSPYSGWVERVAVSDKC